MKKKEEEFNKIELTGWVLFMLLMIPFVLLLMAEPSFNESDPQLPNWIGWGWIGLMFFSAFLIIVGNMASKHSK